MWNCTELDLFVNEVHQVAHTGEVGVMIIVGGLLLLGSLLIVAGEQLVRPLGAVVGGIGGTVATFIVTAMFDMTCEARLIMSGIVGVFVAGLALFVLKTGVFLLGAGGLAAVTHIVYDSLPLEIPVEGNFVLLGRSGYYYIAMFAAIVVGGLIAYLQRKNVLRIASSLLGGGAWTLAIIVICDRNDTPLPQMAALGILFASTLLGVGIQRWRERRKRKRRRREDMPPMGIPVTYGSRT